ncbi:DNA-3-methyladenine glycosylase II [mine drainage metagenome]|uniref:DNA-(apurinic or apyrimidinic site) lyase n=1 Tax=mine drainage metagenome TaxID=410659 RepID=T0ZRX4_9ZZZZ
MSALNYSFEFDIVPVPPYNFDMTVRNPAGWHLFTPFEVHENGVLWTATHMSSALFGFRLSSKGSVEDPGITVRVFLGEAGSAVEREEIQRLVRKTLGADRDLKEFYSIARNDSILKHAVEHLYGMQDSFPLEIFPDAVLAILLQMAPLKRSNEMIASFIQNYGEPAEFDGRKIYTWPTPDAVSGVSAEELAERCRVGYRAKNLVNLARRLSEGGFPSTEQLEAMEPENAKKKLLELPGIGDYSADIINPHGGFPIDVWSAEVFGKLFFEKEPKNNREAVDKVKREGLKRWGRWSWMAFFYIVQDLPNLSEKLGKRLRLT